MSRARDIADTGDNNLDDIVVDGSGNVGIGTDSPATNAEIVGGSSGSTTNLLQIRSNASTANTGSTIRFTNSDTASSAYGAAEITALRIDVAGDTDLVFKPSKAGTISEAMRIQGDTGNVGIGIASPATPLDVTKAGGGNFVATFQNTTSATPYGVHIKEPASAANGYPSFQVTDNAGTGARFRVDSGTGTVLFGTTSTAAPSLAYIKDSSGGYIEKNSNSTGATTAYDFKINGTRVGSITTSGSSTTYSTSSDYRLKENVVADWDATTRLKQLNPVRFNFIADPDTTVDGFLAHEVQDVVPEAITGTKDAMRDEEYEVTPAVFDEDGNEITPAVMGTRSVPDYQGIDQSKLVPLLVKTIQELEARIAVLENA